MGIVFEARHVGLDTIVAVKFMGEGYAVDEAGVRRFRREARAMGQIRHDNVVRIMDAGLDDRGLPSMRFQSSWFVLAEDC